MPILLHVLIALASVAYTTYLFFFPTQKGLQLAQALVGLTLISGTYLVIIMPAHMVQSCLTGLAYIGFVAVGLVLAKHRLVEQNTN
ncbi:MAG: hypothetical protein WCO52_02190 [bacterium]